MVKPFTWLFILACVLPCDFPCGATDYFVSNTGSDANAGTSSGSPWLTVAKVNGTTFSPGDTIRFKGGDNFAGPLKINQAGTSLSSILISSYGVGMGSIYGDHSNAVWSAVGGHAGIYSTTPSPVNSVEYVADFSGTNYIKNNKGVQPLDDWLNTFVLTNWGFFSGTVYVKTPDGNPPPQMHLFEFAAVEVLKSYTTVTNLDIRAGHHNLLSENTTNFVALWNSVHDSENIGIYLGNWCINALVASNTVTRTGEDSVYLSFAGSCRIAYNNLSWTTNKVLLIPLPSTHAERCGVALQQGTNNLVERNTISNLWGAFFDYFYENGSTVRWNYGFAANGAAFPNGTGLRLYANIFHLNGAGPGMNPAYAYDVGFSSGPDLGTNYILNNTLYAPVSYACFGNGGGSNTVVRNNLFVTTNSTTQQAELTTGANLDYNLYYSTAGSTRWQWNAVNYTTLATFIAASGMDAHSTNANPIFVSSTPILPTDFKLNFASPAIGKGVTVLSIADYTGVAFGNPPTIGAYEFNTLTNVAASCSQADIQAAIAATAPGGTVIVPAGTCAPTISILLTNQITLMAQGTILQDSIINTSDGTNSCIINVAVGPSPTNMTRVSGFTFQTGARATRLAHSGNIHLSGGANNVRIDHNSFLAANNIGIGGGDVFGVIDRNVFSPSGSPVNAIELNHQSYAGTNGYGAWALPSWTNSYQEDGSAMYIENNNFTNSSGVPGKGIDGFGGARWVSRYNVFDRMIDGGQGTDTNGQLAGCRLKDSYNNLFIEHGDPECGHYSSGSGVWVSNVIVTSASGFTCRNNRMAYGGFFRYANATNAWDLNDAAIYATGSATAGGTLSMTDSTKTWTPNQWIGFSIRNVPSGRCSVVTGNTATTVNYIASIDSPASDTAFSPGQAYQFRKVTTVLDEVGRGQGALRNAAAPSWPNQVVDPVWQWANTIQ